VKPEETPHLPQNPDAERAILGAILLDNDTLSTVIEKVNAEDFFDDRHRRTLTHMIQLAAAREPIDLITLTEHLQLTGDLEAAGGPAYLSALIDGVPRISNVAHYAAIVKDVSIRRAAAFVAQSILTNALEGDSASALLEQAHAAFTALSDTQASKGLVGIRKLIPDYSDKIEKIIHEGRRLTGLSTGYNQLDALTSGLQPSELIILAARPSVGKSALALNIAENVSVAGGGPIAIFSLEMSADSLITRLLTSRARINSHLLRTGHIRREDWSAIAQVIGEMMAWKIEIDDSSSSSVIDIAIRASRMKRERGLALAIIDYLQLVSPGTKRPGRRHEEVAEVARSLKALAKDLAVPVLALSQIGRAPEREDRRPQLSDLKESGGLEEAADTVLFIHRPYLFKSKGEISAEQKAQTEMIIAKQRSGPVDLVPFVFLDHRTRFEEAAASSFSWEE
jgi:replicative DNA helicase